MTTLGDYRGFDASEGWRHGVAHGADLLLQLSLNLALDRAQLDAILAAIASQVMPATGHFYIYGEGDRLMAPVFYIGRRGALSTAEWSEWFARLSARRPKAGRGDAGLARRQPRPRRVPAAALRLAAGKRHGGDAGADASRRHRRDQDARLSLALARLSAHGARATVCSIRVIRYRRGTIESISMYSSRAW